MWQTLMDTEMTRAEKATAFLELLSCDDHQHDHDIVANNIYRGNQDSSVKCDNKLHVASPMSLI